MPALVPTVFAGLVTWLGIVPDRDAGLVSVARDRLRLTFAGAEGEAHAGLTRPACSRVAALHPRGTAIRNSRQISLVAAADLQAIATALGLAALDPGLLGATVVVSGLEDLSHLPPSSRLQAPDGATLVIDMENRPCTLPARAIETRHPGAGARFKAAAGGRRGVTAWVEREGVIRLGDRLALHVPDQPAWALQGQVPGRG